MKTKLTLTIALIICLPGWSQPKTALNQNADKIEIIITYIPKYNTIGFIEGKIIGKVNIKESRIATYLYSEEGGGYFNKPYWETPTVRISSNFTFSVDVTTGGNDQKATAYVFLLVPVTYDPPILRGGTIPDELFRRFPYTKVKREKK
jgi:hypothetical protein